MNAYTAFAGDARRKASLVDRLEAHAAAGELRLNGDVWDGTNGRPTGCAARSDDIKVFETETGFPAALGILLNFLHFQMQGAGDEEGRAYANAFAIDWLSRPEPGVNLSPVPHEMIIWALQAEIREEPHPALKQVIDRTIALHREALAGRMPSRQDWAAVRVDAIAATDLVEDKTDKVVGSAVEAVCWDPLTSRSVLVDLARAWAQARYDRAILASGWTPEDQVAADMVLQAIREEKAAQREAGEPIYYQALFAERDRDLADRFAAQIDVGNKAYPEAMAAFAAFGLAALDAAKVGDGRSS